MCIHLQVSDGTQTNMKKEKIVQEKRTAGFRIIADSSIKTCCQSETQAYL